MHFKRHLFFYTLTFIFIITVAASYVRFIVINDYLVTYEGECDPELSSCFVGCEDEECTTSYYYAFVEKHAVDLRRQCGVDITDCPNASVCLPQGDRSCSITYCDPVIDDDSCDSVGEPERNALTEPIS